MTSSALRAIGRALQVLAGVLVLGLIAWGISRLAAAHDRERADAQRAAVEAVVRAAVKPECLRP